MMKFEELFTTLNSLNVNDRKETRKNGKTELSYLSWTWAVTEFTKADPDFDYEIKMFPNEQGVLLPYMYDENTGYMVMTSVTSCGKTKTMWLPVMNGANDAMKNKPYQYKTKWGEVKTVDAATMFDINKTIMRCLTKNLAMFGLGLYIYAGEDLPESDDTPETSKTVIGKPVSSETKAEGDTGTGEAHSEPEIPEYKKLWNQLVELCGDEAKVIEACKKNGVAKKIDLTPFLFARVKNTLEVA